MKYEYNASATDEQIQEYLKVWAAQGLRHPEVYVEGDAFDALGFRVSVRAHPAAHRDMGRGS